MLKVIQPSLSDSTRRNTVQQVVCTALSHSSPLASIHGHVFSSKGKSIHMLSISTALAMLHSGLGDQGYYTSFPAYHHFCETPGPRCTKRDSSEAQSHRHRPKLGSEYLNSLHFVVSDPVFIPA